MPHLYQSLLPETWQRLSRPLWHHGGPQAIEDVRESVAPPTGNERVESPKHPPSITITVVRAGHCALTC